MLMIPLEIGFAFPVVQGLIVSEITRPEAVLVSVLWSIPHSEILLEICVYIHALVDITPSKIQIEDACQYVRLEVGEIR
jgi:hypothetical protein